MILPDHLHAIWTLPPGDADFAMRWRLIKANFTRALAHTEPVSASRLRRRDRAIWQPRYWEHTLRDEDDFSTQIDYIHFNPVKHGYVAEAGAWPFSSFHRMVRPGFYTAAWAGDATSSGDRFGE